MRVGFYGGVEGVTGGCFLLEAENKRVLIDCGLFQGLEEPKNYEPKMSTFGIHKMAWLMVSKRFPWNAKYETAYRWFASYIVIYTIMELKS